MPKFQETISFPSSNEEKIFAAAYSAFEALGWDVSFAGDAGILGATPARLSGKKEEITFTYNNGEAVVKSEMRHGQSFDLTGRNKKNTAAFKVAISNAYSSITPETIAINTATLQVLREKTRIAAEHEEKEAEEIRKAMNLNGSNLYATYSIIGINVLVFILMAVDGAGIIDLNGLVHIKWGSNFSPLTLSGDWWRLFTNIFIHFGIIHLLMNMYALYMVGIYLEPMLGKVKYLTAYLCTGIVASVVSLWWHTDTVNSAGASGAIFGMYGLFLALLTTDLIPAAVRKALLSSIGIFVLYNLAYGMKGNIDNSAHVGGLVSGFIFGYLFVISIKAEKKERRAAWVLPAIILLSAGASYYYLAEHKAPVEERQKILAEVKDAGFKDNDKFASLYSDFIRLQEKATGSKDSSLTDAALKQKLQEISAPAWNSAEEIATRMQLLNVSEVQHKKADALLEYITLRRQEINAIIAVIDSGQSLLPQLHQIQDKLNVVLQKLN